MIRIESMKIILKLAARQQIRRHFLRGNNPEGMRCCLVKQMVPLGAKTPQFALR